MDKIMNNLKVIEKIEREAGALCELCSGKARLVLDKTGLSHRTRIEQADGTVGWTWIWPSTRGDKCFYHGQVAKSDWLRQGGMER